MLGLTNSNLISLCNSCHNLEHPEKTIKARGYRHDGTFIEPAPKEPEPKELKEFGERW